MNELISNVMESSPLIAGARAIGKVGEGAMNVYDLVRAYWQPKKKKQIGDIVLPHESYAPRSFRHANNK